MKSIIQSKKECFECMSYSNLEEHHIFFGTANRKFRAYEGQYIMVYNKSQDDVLNIYTLPDKCVLVPISGCFLRGTSLFTDENKKNFKTYTGKDSDSIPTQGGLDSVKLWKSNFPKHRHWSTLLSGLPSSLAVTDGTAKGGGTGTEISKNDPVSGGLRYGLTDGSGNYKYNVKNVGVPDGEFHNNKPAFQTLGVYLVKRNE